MAENICLVVVPIFGSRAVLCRKKLKLIIMILKIFIISVKTRHGIYDQIRPLAYSTAQNTPPGPVQYSAVHLKTAPPLPATRLLLRPRRVPAILVILPMFPTITDGLSYSVYPWFQNPRLCLSLPSLACLPVHLNNID